MSVHQAMLVDLENGSPAKAFVKPAFSIVPHRNHQTIRSDGSAIARRVGVQALDQFAEALFVHGSTVSVNLTQPLAVRTLNPGVLSVW